MPALQVRDFPEDLYEQLRERARQEHRSIAQQTIIAVEEYLRRDEEAIGPKASTVIPFPEGGTYETNWYSETPEARIEKRKRLFAKINARGEIKVPEGFPSSEEILREIRDSR